MPVAHLFWGGFFLCLTFFPLALLGSRWKKPWPSPGAPRGPSGVPGLSPRLSLLIATAATLVATAFIHPQPTLRSGASSPPAPARPAFVVPPQGLPPLSPWFESGKAEAGLPHASAGLLAGVASWYGPGFEGRKTASGERFRSSRHTLASRLLPLGSTVEIINLANGRRLTARVNDRGPYVPGRKFDVSRGIAQKLGFQRQGLAQVQVRLVGPDRSSSR